MSTTWFATSWTSRGALLPDDRPALAARRGADHALRRVRLGRSRSRVLRNLRSALVARTRGWARCVAAGGICGGPWRAPAGAVRCEFAVSAPAARFARTVSRGAGGAVPGADRLRVTRMASTVDRRQRARLPTTVPAL